MFQYHYQCFYYPYKEEKKVDCILIGYNPLIFIAYNPSLGRKFSFKFCIIEGYITSKQEVENFIS